MELYFATRGNKFWVDRFITQLQGKSFPFKYQGKDTTIEFAVRPIQLWCVAFPKEYKDIVLTSILSEAGGPSQAHAGKYDHLDKYFRLLQKAMHLDKIPKDYNTSQMMFVDASNVDRIGIGMKEDKEYDFGEGI